MSKTPLRDLRSCRQRLADYSHHHLYIEDFAFVMGHKLYTMKRRLKAKRLPKGGFNLASSKQTWTREQVSLYIDKVFAVEIGSLARLSSYSKPFLGLYELAYVLGVSSAALLNRAANAPYNLPAMPEPETRLKSGPIWRREKVNVWLLTQGFYPKNGDSSRVFSS